MRITTRRMFDIYDMMTTFKGYAGLTHLFLCVCECLRCNEQVYDGGWTALTVRVCVFMA